MNDRTAMRLLIFFISLIALGTVMNIAVAVHAFGQWMGWW